MRPDGSRAYSGTATAAVPHYRPPCRRGGPPVVDVPHSGRRAEGRVPSASRPSMRPDGVPRLQWHRHGRRAKLPAAVPKGRAPYENIPRGIDLLPRPPCHITGRRAEGEGPLRPPCHTYGRRAILTAAVPYLRPPCQYST